MNKKLFMNIAGILSVISVFSGTDEASAQVAQQDSSSNKQTVSSNSHVDYSFAVRAAHERKRGT